MRKRCYVLLYENNLDSGLSFIIPIKSSKIRSLYADMPQFFGGGSLHNETNIQTIKRELNEESCGFFYLKERAKLKLVHTNTLKKKDSRIRFYFYITSDFISNSKIQCFPIVFSGNNEMSSILKLNFSYKQIEGLSSICSLLNLLPSYHFQKSETNKAFTYALKNIIKS